MKKTTISLLIILVVLIIDQVLKIYIKTNFVLYESYEVTSWFYLSFTENNGMALGIELFDKFLLTSFRIAAVLLFGYLLSRFIKSSKCKMGFVIVVSMIIAGAIGNIIDCVFYGKLFTDSYGHIAHFADAAKGLPCYGEWFRGRVVDMFYFPLFHFDWPSWFPHTHQELFEIAGTKVIWPNWAPTCDREFVFFRPIFNFADAVISVGVVILILFYTDSFKDYLYFSGKKK